MFLALAFIIKLQKNEKCGVDVAVYIEYAKPFYVLLQIKSFFSVMDFKHVICMVSRFLQPIVIYVIFHLAKLDQILCHIARTSAHHPRTHRPGGAWEKALLWCKGGLKGPYW